MLLVHMFCRVDHLFWDSRLVCSLLGKTLSPTLGIPYFNHCFQCTRVSRKQATATLWGLAYADYLDLVRSGWFLLPPYLRSKKQSLGMEKVVDSKDLQHWVWVNMDVALCWFVCEFINLLSFSESFPRVYDPSITIMMVPKDLLTPTSCRST